MQVAALSLLVLSALQPPPNAQAMATAADNVGSYKAVTGEKELLQKLVGHMPPLTQSADRLQRLSAQQEMTLSFVLPFNNASDLDALLAAQHDRTSPNYHKYLTPAQFAERFHPTTEQVAQTNAFLRAHGMTPVSSHGLMVKATGTVATVEALLHTELYNYQSNEGRSFFAPAYELQIPAGSGIRAVLGLSNAAQPHHNAILKGKLKARNDDAQSSGNYNANNVRQAYNIPSTATGAGQTLALMELDGYTASDLTGYAQANNLPQPNVTNIMVDNYDGSAGDGAGEVTLDIELMMALAPSAGLIQVYEAPNSGMSDVWNEMANPTQGETLPTIISCSWGISETSLSQSDVQADYNIFKQMAAQGQTVFSAAGDSGAYDNGYSLSVDEPAASPYVVGVGGTALYVDSQGNYSSERTWADGGGGISRFWATPSWQQGILGAGSRGSTKHRNVPDVSLNADPNTGYAIYFQGGWVVYGGTSCAAPLWAAYLGLVEQARANAKLQPLGYFMPTLYTVAKANQASLMHDVTTGNNGWYPAVKGFDDATGWGSFNGGAMLDALLQQP